MTHAPTFFPSSRPTTSVPTSAPSITGAVSVIELSKAVEESLDDSEVANITSEVAEAYGVDEEDITVEIVYQTTGSINISFNGTVDEDELGEALEEEIASLLGVHESSVDVTVANGTASYVITSDSAEEASEALETMSGSNVTAIIGDAIDESFPVSIEHIVVDDDINAEVIITVDISDASERLNDAAEKVEDAFESYGYNATAESKRYLFMSPHGRQRRTLLSCFELAKFMHKLMIVLRYRPIIT